MVDDLPHACSGPEACPRLAGPPEVLAPGVGATYKITGPSASKVLRMPAGLFIAIETASGRAVLWGGSALPKFARQTK